MSLPSGEPTTREWLSGLALIALVIVVALFAWAAFNPDAFATVAP